VFSLQFSLLNFILRLLVIWSDFTTVDLYALRSAELPCVLRLQFAENQQTDGCPPLFATPGANLSAAKINFSNCN